jgi:hypothetical protein
MASTLSEAKAVLSSVVNLSLTVLLDNIQVVVTILGLYLGFGFLCFWVREGSFCVSYALFNATIKFKLCADRAAWPIAGIGCLKKLE